MNTDANTLKRIDTNQFTKIIKKNKQKITAQS